MSLSVVESCFQGSEYSGALLLRQFTEGGQPAPAYRPFLRVKHMALQSASMEQILASARPTAWAASLIRVAPSSDWMRPDSLGQAIQRPLAG